MECLLTRTFKLKMEFGRISPCSYHMFLSRWHIIFILLVKKVCGVAKVQNYLLTRTLEHILKEILHSKLRFDHELKL